MSKTNVDSYVKVAEIPIEQQFENTFRRYMTVDIFDIYRECSHDVERTFTQIIKAESPIHIEEFCRKVMPLYDQGRLTAKFRGQIESILNRIEAHNIIKRDQDFILFSAMQGFPARIPQAGDTPRSIDYVHPKEISQIMLQVIDSTIGLSVGECIQYTAQLMGYSHCGINIKNALNLSLNILVEHNFVEVIDGKLRKVSSN